MDLEKLLKETDDLLKEMKKLKARLDKLDKKLNNGQIIELPCKVGDTIYHIKWTKYNQVRELKTEKVKDIRVDNSYIEETIVEFVCDYDYDEYGQNTISVYNDEYNKTWFTDKELAEKKLEELNNENL